MGEIGAFCFGLVMGWVAYRTLRRSEDGFGLSDLSSVLGAVGGAAVMTLFDDDDLFGNYAVGLAAGFFGYLFVSMILEGRKVRVWMAAQVDPPQRRPSSERPAR